MAGYPQPAGQLRARQEKARIMPPLPERADIVIIGAGQAGFQVATSLRQKRFEGSILLLGDECYAPYHRPPLSKAALKEGMNEATLWLRPEAFYETQKIDLRRGMRVAAIDRAGQQVRTADGHRIGYGSLVLATGARARPLPDKLAAADQAIHVLRSLDNAHALQPLLKPGLHVAIIGAGYIGLEVAASARHLGAEVVVIDREARLLARTASPIIAAHMQNLHARHGVRFQLADTIEKLANGEIVCGSGTRVRADLVVVGIGVLANDELAAEAGLDVQDGILADLQGRTSDPAIYAAGDCARHAHAGFGESVRFESVQSAIDQGKVVASSILGEAAQHHAVPWFWSDQYDAKLQMVGVVPGTANGGTQAFIKGDPASGSFAVYHLDAQRLVALEAVNAPHDFVLARKQIGPDAVMDEAAMEGLVGIGR